MTAESLTVSSQYTAEQLSHEVIASQIDKNKLKDANPSKSQKLLAFYILYALATTDMGKTQQDSLKNNTDFMQTLSGIQTQDINKASNESKEFVTDMQDAKEGKPLQYTDIGGVHVNGNSIDLQSVYEEYKEFINAWNYISTHSSANNPYWNSESHLVNIYQKLLNNMNLPANIQKALENAIENHSSFSQMQSALQGALGQYAQKEIQTNIQPAFSEFQTKVSQNKKQAETTMNMMSETVSNANQNLSNNYSSAQTAYKAFSFLLTLLKKTYA